MAEENDEQTGAHPMAAKKPSTDHPLYSLLQTRRAKVLAGMAQNVEAQGPAGSNLDGCFGESLCNQRRARECLACPE